MSEDQGLEALILATAPASPDEFAAHLAALARSYQVQVDLAKAHERDLRDLHKLVTRLVLVVEALERGGRPNPRHVQRVLAEGRAAALRSVA